MSEQDENSSIRMQDIGDQRKCTNCGKPFILHYHENEDYCYSHTNGDIFTVEVDEEEQEVMAMEGTILDLQKMVSDLEKANAAYVWKLLSLNGILLDAIDSIRLYGNTKFNYDLLDIWIIQAKSITLESEADMPDRRIAIAYVNNHGIWPEELTSGVMFYDGLRITVNDFADYRKLIGGKNE